MRHLAILMLVGWMTGALAYAERPFYNIDAETDHSNNDDILEMRIAIVLSNDDRIHELSALTQSLLPDRTALSVESESAGSDGTFSAFGAGDSLTVHTGGGMPAGGSTQVPEPGAASLLGLGAFLLLRSRRTARSKSS